LNLKKEIQLLEQLHHPNIVRYVDCNLINDFCMHIVMEYMENGSLKNIVERFGVFSESLAARYTSQFMQGLEYLHQRDILHRDIKGANILITKEGICKLADFGVATKLQPGLDDSGAAGTTYWSKLKF
jgi:serine/threonine protein kinase